MEHGAKINTTDKDGRTPLLDAIRARSKDAMQTLIDHDANPNAEENEGRTPLMNTAQAGSKDAGQTPRVGRIFVDRANAARDCRLFFAVLLQCSGILGLKNEGAK